MIENANATTRIEAYQPPILIAGKDKVDLTRRPELESEAALRRLNQLESWLETERMRQAQNRYQQAIDDDFFDGLQWSEEDAATLIERGQAPLVFNKISPAIRWVTGTEKRTRIDFKVYPRSDDDAAAAEAKTKLLKYVADVNKSQFARSRAFGDALRVGVGWLECGINADPTKELLFDRYESWRNILYDSLGPSADGEDWRYIVRQKSVDTDIACMLFPEQAQYIETASSFSEQVADDSDNDEWYLGSLLRENYEADGYIPARRSFVDATTNTYNRRARIKLYEMWYRYPTKVYLNQGGTFHGQEFDSRNARMLQERNAQLSTVTEAVVMRMRVAIFIKGHFLQDIRSPYRHDKFPFTPIWGNRRARDMMAYGMIRNMRDPQEDFNKRMSKAQHAISTRRIIMDEGAVEDIDELREEAARPDAIIVRRPGKELKIEADLAVAEHHIAYAEIDSRVLQDTSGVTDENMGKRTNATSGIAIERRQEQGSAVTTDYFDNLRYGIQIHGEKLLSLVEQFYTMPKQIRILGERQGYDFTGINWAKTGADGQPEIENDITASQADFVVSQQDFRESMRQAAFETLMEMLMKLATVSPDVALRLLDDVLEMSDLPGKEDIVASVREITGKQARDKRLTPEEEQLAEQAKAAEKQKAAMLEDLNMRGLAAEVMQKEAAANKLSAEADRLRAEAQADGIDNPMVAELEAQLETIREDTTKLLDAMRVKVDEERAKARDRGAELAQRDAEAKAKIASDERIALAKIDSAERIAQVDAAAKRDVAVAAEDARVPVEQVRANATLEAARIAQVDGGKLNEVSTKSEKRIGQLEQTIAKFAAETKAKLDEVAVGAREQLVSVKEKAGAEAEKVAKPVAELQARIEKLEKALTDALAATKAAPKAKTKVIKIKRGKDGSLEGEMKE